ncbi:MAG: ribonuclease HII [Candidatus Pacearchaeota archaeon]
MDLIIGIDDAGRGPVIGPMVLAGCLINSEIESELKNLGVRDSKQLTQKRREFLEKIIKEKAIAFYVETLSPREIDNKQGYGNLNDLEAIMASKIINKLNRSDQKIKVILDCPSPNRIKWRDTVKFQIKNLSNLDIICEHKADINHIAVSAASILAKCQREREMDKLREIYGEEIGSGYASDPITKKFLERNIKNKDHKEIFRKSWKTWKKANHDAWQKKLFLTYFI